MVEDEDKLRQKLRDRRLASGLLKKVICQKEAQVQKLKKELKEVDQEIETICKELAGQGTLF